MAFVVGSGKPRKERAALLRPCPVCLNRAAEVLHRQSFAAPRELHVPAEYDVVGCDRCGFVYADQAFTQADLDRDYESHSKYAANVTSVPEAIALTTVPTDAPWDTRRLEDVATYLAEQIAPTARVLDLGCSSGTFLRSLRERGVADVVGLDPSHAAVRRAIEENGVRAYAGSCTSPPSDLGTFDVVALSHTLEHIADVRKAVAVLHGLLRHDGLAYVEVPDAERYDRYLVAPFHDFNTEHINHFSLDVLRALMRDCGFDEVDVGRKVVHCSARDEYPAIYGLWRRRDAGVLDGFTFDGSLVAAARRYVEASCARMLEIDAHLRTTLRGHDEVIVWGAGQLAMKLMAETVLREKRVVAIVDSSPQRHGMHVGDVEIVAPSALERLKPYPIVIASIHSDDAIVESIRSLGDIENDVIRLPRGGSPLQR